MNDMKTDPDNLMARFIPGLELAEAFFHEKIAPILARHFPNLRYSAAKLHRGSDVLGFDTPRSMDHDWGASKIDIFLHEDDYPLFADSISNLLADELPHEFRGLPTDFLTSDIDGGTIGYVAEGPVQHRIRMTTITRFFRYYINLDPRESIQPYQWLLIPPQYLRTITHGKVFHDGLQQLCDIQNRMMWYPHDVWLYLLACQWRKIDQEEPFMARCGDVGDAFGSRLMAARQVQEIMRLCFLMERQYWPYTKWFGTAFSGLKCAPLYTPLFHGIFDSQQWQDREEHLSSVYLQLAKQHNALNITETIEPKIGPFHTRPYKVPYSERFVTALYSQIHSEAVLRFPRDLGGVGQYVDSTDVLDRPMRCRKLETLYVGK